MLDIYTGQIWVDKIPVKLSFSEDDVSKDQKWMSVEILVAPISRQQLDNNYN